MRTAAPTRLALVAVAAALTAGCAATYVSHGFAPHPDEVAQIQPGADTRGSVARRFGRPSVEGLTGDDQWFYVASRFEKFAFYEPELIDRTVVAVSFDDAGVVTDVKSLGVQDGRVVDLVTRTTPTYGRELNVIQQLFGNIGRVDPGQTFGDQRIGR
jgi:outer membrane protein assembly factor BamE (lipoprotein component of BamABCDE complex)